MKPRQYNLVPVLASQLPMCTSIEVSSQYINDNDIVDINKAANLWSAIKQEKEDYKINYIKKTQPRPQRNVAHIQQTEKVKQMVDDAFRLSYLKVQSVNQTGIPQQLFGDRPFQSAKQRRFVSGLQLDNQVTSVRTRLENTKAILKIRQKDNYNIQADFANMNLQYVNRGRTKSAQVLVSRSNSQSAYIRSKAQLPLMSVIEIPKPNL